MKTILSLSVLLLCSTFIYAQSNNPKYNKALADSLGADDYGMKSYVFVILKTGSNPITDKKKIDSLFKGHMSNIEKMAAAGKLVVAGPMKRNEKEYRGIFILNVKTFEEALKLLENDPAIKQKLIDAEMYSWYGSAALPLYLPSHEKLEKKKL